MASAYKHQSFGFLQRVSQSLRNDRCQTILYKAVFEHATPASIAALLVASKSFQNSSFGANFLVNFVVDDKTISLLESVFSSSSCFSLQFVPSLRIEQSTSDSAKTNRSITSFVGELVNTKYLRASLRLLTLHCVTSEVLSYFFGSSSSVWPQLRDLALKDCEVNDTDLEIISRNAVQLRAVDFSWSPMITDVGIEHISKLSCITSLNLSYCGNITDAGIEHLSKLSRITSLNLTCCNLITDLGLEHVSKLSDITSLDLGCCRMITDAGLECISKLDGITFLGLVACFRISDVGLERFSHLSGITSLDLCGCHNITDAGLAHISKLTDITSLDLSYCSKITDVGVQHLWKLPDCTSLNLADCYNVTVAKTKQLKSALPNCTINE